MCMCNDKNCVNAMGMLKQKTTPGPYGVLKQKVIVCLTTLLGRFEKMCTPSPTEICAGLGQKRRLKKVWTASNQARW